MGRCLWPRSQLIEANTRVHFDSSVGTINRSNPVDDKPGLNSWVETELFHIIYEAFRSVLHYATSAFWRMDTNRASFSITTMSLSS